MKTTIRVGIIILLGLVLIGIQQAKSQKQDATANMKKQYDDKNLKRATFAGGCFWCTESDFEKVATHWCTSPP